MNQLETSVREMLDDQSKPLEERQKLSHKFERQQSTLTSIAVNAIQSNGDLFDRIEKEMKAEDPFVYHTMVVASENADPYQARDLKELALTVYAATKVGYNF